jgi:hypothetical protein
LYRKGLSNTEHLHLSDPGLEAGNSKCEEIEG